MLDTNHVFATIIIDHFLEAHTPGCRVDISAAGLQKDTQAP